MAWGGGRTVGGRAFSSPPSSLSLSLSLSLSSLTGTRIRLAMIAVHLIAVPLPPPRKRRWETPQTQLNEGWGREPPPTPFPTLNPPTPPSLTCRSPRSWPGTRAGRTQNTRRSMRRARRATRGWRRGRRGTPCNPWRRGPWFGSRGGCAGARDRCGGVCGTGPVAGEASFVGKPSPRGRTALARSSARSRHMASHLAALSLVARGRRGQRRRRARGGRVWGCARPARWLPKCAG